MPSIVDHLFLERRRRGISQAELAAASGIAASNISAHESGSRTPTVSTLEAIAEALDLRLLALDLSSRRTVFDHAENISQQPDLLRIHRLHEDLSSVDPATAVVLAAVPPRHLSLHLDAVIAGVVEWCLGQHHAPLPTWVSSWGLDLDEPWRPDGSEPTAEGTVPQPLSRRNVLVTDAELRHRSQVGEIFWTDELPDEDREDQVPTVR